ncbi:unannotated protein [freshwater metagenome]|uniref:Unannotated protein n=1 Tax=freshwater metagenome TaxID=449393 RepID=A0A6J7JXN5_9ZZZZ
MFDEVGTNRVFAIDAIVVLSGDKHGAQTNRLAVFVIEGDLSLAIGTKIRNRAGLANISQALGHAVSNMDRKRHEHIGLIARVAEHHSLIARTLLIEDVFARGAGANFFRIVNALSDVG